MKIAQKLPPLSLYIHIPWCEKKCPYCDFNSHENFKMEYETQYIKCLLNDLDADLHWAKNRELQSIFIGGGTPSVFSSESISTLLNEIQKRIAYSSSIEITMEANPASSQGDYFAALKETLLNRISIGIQSFQTPQLKSLGRLHSSEDAHNALAALNQHFDNFNIDLMFGLPGQRLASGMDDLEKALSYSPTHLSWYQLTIEPNTVFFRERPQLPNENMTEALQQNGKALLQEHEFQHYEISAFAQAGKQSVHNLNYWRFGDYLAIGAGAHGKVSTFNGDNQRLEQYRFQKTRLPKDYMKRYQQRAEIKEVTPKLSRIPESELTLEYLMNHLRLNEAIHFDSFEKATGLQRHVLDKFLSKAHNMQLLEYNTQQFKKTERGERFLDSLLSLVD